MQQSHSQTQQNDMHCLYKEITHPTSVQHAIRASFLSPFAQNLIVIKVGKIEIYNIDLEAGKSLTNQQLLTTIHNNKTTTPHSTFPSLPSSTTLHQNLLTNTVTAPILSLHTSAQLYGTVIGVKSIHLPNQTTESIVLLFDNNNISVIHWDPVSLCICTIFVYNAELRDMTVPHGVTAPTTSATLGSIHTDGSDQANLKRKQPKHIEEDRLGLQHQQQEQLYDSLLEVDAKNNLIILIQAGTYISIFAPNPQCDYMLFSPGRASLLSPLFTSQYNTISNDLYSQNHTTQADQIVDYIPTLQLHVETPHHCSHLLRTVPQNKLAMVYVQTFNLRQRNDPKLKDIIWIKDCVTCFSKSEPILVCLASTAFTWEGRYAAKKLSTGLVTVSLSKPVFHPTTGEITFTPPQVKLAQQHLPHHAYKLSVLPQPLLGCLLLTTESIFYYNLTTVQFSTKLNFFDALQQSAIDVDGVRPGAGTILDRVSLSCVYAVVEKYSKTGANSTSGSSLLQSSTHGQSAMSNFDDLDSLFNMDDDSSGQNNQNTAQHDQNYSNSAQNSSTSTNTDKIYPLRELYNPDYLLDPSIQPFSIYPNITSEFNHLDDKNDKSRYLEYLVTAANGNSFVLSITFSTASQMESLQLGYLGMLSPVNAFIPLVIGAPVHDDITTTSKNVKKRENISTLLFAAALWGDSKVYHFQREITTSSQTMYNSKGNQLIECYNILLEGSEHGYPIFSELDEQHQTLINSLRQAFGKQQFPQTIVKIHGDIGDDDEVIIESNSLQNILNPGTEDTANSISAPSSDEYGELSFDFDYLKQLGVVLDTDEAKNKELYQKQKAQKKQHQQLLKELQKSRGQNTTGPSADDDDDTESNDFLLLQQQQQELEQKDGKNANDDDEEDEDELNDEDYEDDITYDQRKRRLYRPIIPPWLVIERDLFFSLAPLNNIQPISTSLLSAHTNSTTSVMQSSTKEDNIQNFGDTIPNAVLPFTNETIQNDVISLLATGSYCNDGKMVVYNDCMMPQVISTQTIQTSHIPQLLSPTHTVPTPGNPISGSENTPLVLPNDVITGMFSFNIRDIPQYVQSVLNHLHPSPAATYKPNGSNLDQLLAASNTTVFDIDPVLALHKTKQILRTQGFAHNKSPINPRSPSPSTSSTSYHTALTQYQSSLLFFDQLTSSSSLLTPFHHTTPEAIDPSISTVLVLTTTSSTFFYTLPTTLSESQSRLSKDVDESASNGTQGETVVKKTPQELFFAEFQEQLRSYEYMHKNTLKHQLEEQQNHWKQSHGELQQEQWPMYTFQHVLGNQQEQFNKQQSNHIGCHSHDIARILQSLGATQYTPITSIPTLLDRNVEDDESDAKSLQTIQDTIYTPSSTCKTLKCGPIMGLFHAWVQITPNNVLLCCNSSYVLCNISLKKILQKARHQLLSAGYTPQDINFGMIGNESMNNDDVSSMSANGELKQPISIMSALIQDPYVILHLSNELLIRIEFNSSPLSPNWYSITVISFSTPLPLQFSTSPNSSSSSTGSVTPKSTSDTTYTTHNQNNSQVGSNLFKKSDKISAITTAEIDLFSICPQLRNLLTSTLYRLESLDAAYQRFEKTTLRRDFASKMRSQRDFAQSVGYSGLASSNLLQPTDVDELDVMLGRDELDMAFDFDNNTDGNINDIDCSTNASRGDILLSNNIANKIDSTNTALNSMLASLPSLKLLLVSTLSYFYIIDLASIEPSSLFAIHLEIEQNAVQNDTNGQSGDTNTFAQKGYIAIPLVTTPSPGSSLHTLHNVQPISLSYPNMNPNNVQNGLHGQIQDKVVESTPIREILFGQFNPTNFSQGCTNNNNPSNNHYITLRDQHNHVYIYSITEALLSYLPRKLLNITTYIRNIVPKQYPQFAHIITQSSTTNLTNIGQDRAQFMTFLDVFFEYLLLLQSVQSATPSTFSTPLAFNSKQAMLTPQDYLTTLHKPTDIFGASFLPCNLSQFHTILTSIISTLPLSFRLEYTSVDDRLFIDQKTALDYYPNQLKEDLKRYGGILYDLFTKYHTLSRKRAQQQARQDARLTLVGNATNNGENDEDAANSVPISTNNNTQISSTQFVVSDSSDDNSSDESDLDTSNTFHSSKFNKNNKKDKNQNTSNSLTSSSPDFIITTEFSIQNEIKQILYDFAINNNAGPLEPHHFNTTYDEFIEFEKKLLLYNRLQSYSILQRLNNHQQAELYNKLSLLPKVDNYYAIKHFNSDDDQSLSLAMTLLSFSTNYHIKLKMQINQIITTLKEQHNTSPINSTLPTPTSFPSNSNSTPASTSIFNQNYIDLTNLSPLAKLLVDTELDQFRRTKEYYFTHLQQFNLTTLSSSNTLIPFSHNNHHGIVVMGLTPQFLLFNHNTNSNTITTLPLYFHSPAATLTAIPQAVLATNKAVSANPIDYIPTQHPTFSQTSTTTYDPASLATFYTRPSFITSMTTISLPHLQTNCLLFVDISNTLITCQLPPKFPTTTPTTGSTTSFNPPNDGIFPTELTLFNWNLNKQSTDSITSNKLITYNAASKTMHKEQQKVLHSNIRHIQKKLTQLSSKILLSKVNTSDELSEIVFGGNYKGSSSVGYILTNPTPIITNDISMNDNDEVQLEPLDDVSSPVHISQLVQKPIPNPITPKDDLEDLFGDNNDDNSNNNKRSLPQDDLDDLFGDATPPAPTPPLQTFSQSVPIPKKQKTTTDGSNTNSQKLRCSSKVPPQAPFDYTTPSSSQFTQIAKRFELTSSQQSTLLYTALFTQTISQYSPLNTYFQLQLTTNAQNTTTLHLGCIVQSPLPRQAHLSSPSPSAQSAAYIYTNPTPNGMLRIKQLLKTPTHLVVHPISQTICVATRTFIETGSAEEVPAYTMPIMVSSYQLDFFAISTGLWLNAYNVLNHVAREFKAFQRHEESLSTVSLLTLYDDKAHQVQHKVLKTATKSKFGVWCSSGDPITPQTHPQAYNTITYLAIATSCRDGPLKPSRSKMTLLDISTRFSRNQYGYSTQHLKVQRILEHLERMPIHGLSVLSFDLQKPKQLSYPVGDDRIAYINNYANPFNHFHTHIALACGFKVFIYRIDYDEGKLVGEAFYECSLFITSIYTMKNLIVVNDVLKSVTILVYDVANRNLRLFALDHNATFPLTTSSPFTAARKLSLLVFDYNSHVSNVEYSMEDLVSIRHKRLVNTFKYYLGQSVLSSTQLHIGDIANKSQLNNLSKLIDVTSKQPLLMTSLINTKQMFKPTKSTHSTLPSLYQALTTPFVVVDDDDDDELDDDDDNDDGDIDMGDNFHDDEYDEYLTTSSQSQSNSSKDLPSSSASASAPSNISTGGTSVSTTAGGTTKATVNIFTEGAITSGALTTSLTTHGFDLPLTLQYHYSHLYKSITTRIQNMRPPIQYNNIFNKQFQYIVEQYNAQFNNLVRFDDALQSYFTLFHQTPIKQSLSTGFLISLSAYGTQTITTASYGSTQQGALLSFIPITSTQQLLLTQLSTLLQKHFPFIAATLPSLYHEARSSANFNTEFQRLTSDHRHYNQQQRDQHLDQTANQYQTHTKQRHVIDFSLLSMFLSLQQGQKRVLAKSLATTLNTLLDLIKYLSLSTYLHPLA